MSPIKSTDEMSLDQRTPRRKAQSAGLQRRRALQALAFLFYCCFFSIVRAAPVEVTGQWYQNAAASPGHVEHWQAVEQPSLVVGKYRFEGGFNIPTAGDYVIDFKNTSILDRFEHEVLTADGVLVAKLTGGIQQTQFNPFPQRHGRSLELTAGRYRLITHLDSPFLLGQPLPYVDDWSHYNRSIRAGNTLVLLCLGIFIGLGIYYLALAAVRRDLAHALYATFIAGNLLYSSAAHLLVNDWFGTSSIYLTSMPVLFSNIAYVWFVMCLLDIRHTNTPALNISGRLTLAILWGFLGLAAWQPHWSMELARYGVALFLIYGMVAGLWRSVTGNSMARWYLLANTGLFAAGWMAISNHALEGLFTFHIEHVGLLAVTIEVLLLAFVLSYQVGELQRERAHALERAEHHLRLAMTDALTGLPNRYALESAVATLPAGGALTFIDLDGLKRYNDLYGHEQGDRLLCAFGQMLTELLRPHATLHRFGGDEFVATTPTGQIAHIELMVSKAVDALRMNGFEVNGASCGSVYAHECATREGLKQLADARMYENKRRSTESAAFGLQDDSPPAARIVQETST